ncbi:hypothetical protein [Couchioplanes caeruleus]|nr:hypothetical protein [Couchioplanes caeruleus]
MGSETQSVALTLVSGTGSATGVARHWLQIIVDLLNQILSILRP